MLELEYIMGFTYQRRLPSPLHPVQAYKERRWRLTLALIVLAVQFDVVEDERYAMLGLVINDFRHND